MAFEIKLSLPDRNVYTALSTDTKNTVVTSPTDLCYETDTRDLFEFNGVAWAKIRTTTNSGASAEVVSHPDAFAHERNAGTSNQYGVGVGECNLTTAAANGNRIISAVPSLCFGILMQNGNTGAVTIKDGATTLFSITIGDSQFIDLKGAKFADGIELTTAVLGACVVLWRPQG